MGAGGEAHKGVMLADRPLHTVKVNQTTTPFRPSCATEQLEPIGLSPVKKVHAHDAIEKPPSITHYYKKELAGLEAQQRAAKEMAAQQAQVETAKHQAVTEFTGKLRSAILAGENVTEFWRPAAKAASVRASLTLPRQTAGTASWTLTQEQQAEAERLQAEVLNFVDKAVVEAQEVIKSKMAATSAAAAPSSSSPAGGGAADGQQGPPAKAVAAGPSSAAASSADKAAAGPSGNGSSSSPAAAGPSGSGAAAGAGKRPGSSTSQRGGAAGGSSSKPAWALSSNEVAAMEAAEEDELLKFADELDNLDAFIEQLDDVELQDALKALQEAEAAAQPGGQHDKAWKSNFVKALNHVSMRSVAAQIQQAKAAGKGGNDDCASVAGRSVGGESAVSRSTAASKIKSEAGLAKRAAVAAAVAAANEEANKWDSSTKAGDDVARMEKSEKTKVAEDVLSENPDMKFTHSPASVRALLQRTEQQVTAGAAAGTPRAG